MPHCAGERRVHEDQLFTVHSSDVISSHCISLLGSQAGMPMKCAVALEMNINALPTPPIGAGAC
jgi:hypothetical protein